MEGFDREMPTYRVAVVQDHLSCTQSLYLKRDVDGLPVDEATWADFCDQVDAILRKWVRRAMLVGSLLFLPTLAAIALLVVDVLTGEDLNIYGYSLIGGGFLLELMAAYVLEKRCVEDLQQFLETQSMLNEARLDRESSSCCGLDFDYHVVIECGADENESTDNV